MKTKTPKEHQKECAQSDRCRLRRERRNQAKQIQRLPAQLRGKISRMSPGLRGAAIAEAQREKRD